MENKLLIASEVTEKGKRTRVIIGRRACNIFVNTTVEDRDLTSHVKNIRDPDAEDLTDEEILATVAGMYGFKKWPCKAVILDRINATPAAISTNFCHTSPEHRIEVAKKPELEVVSTVETGLSTTLASAKGKSATVKGNTLTIVNDEIVMLVIPTNESRNFNGKEEMLEQAGAREVAPVTREMEVKKQ